MTDGIGLPPVDNLLDGYNAAQGVIPLPSPLAEANAQLRVLYENDNLKALHFNEKYETLISDLFLKPNPYMRISINGKTVNRIAGWQTGDASGIVVGGDDGSFSITDEVICLPIPLEGLVLRTKSTFHDELRMNVDFVRPFTADDFMLVRVMKDTVDKV